MRRMAFVSSIMGLVLWVPPAGAQGGCPQPDLNHSPATHGRARSHTMSCGIYKVSSLVVSEDAGLGRIDLHGDTLAALQRDEGIVTLVDIEDPERPRVLGRFDNGAVASLDGDIAFSEDGRWLFYARQTDQFSQDGLHVLDVSDPAAPRQAFYQPQGGASRIAYYRDDAGEWVFSLDALGGFVVNRFEPASGVLAPAHVDALPASKVGGPASAGLEIVAQDEAFDGRPTLYVTTGRTDLQVFDISDPARPIQLAARQRDPGGYAEIEVAGGTVYAATEYWFQASNPPQIDIFGFRSKKTRSLSVTKSPDALWRVQGMEATERFLYVALSHAGLVVFDKQGRIDALDQRFGERNELSRSPAAAPYAYDVAVAGEMVYLSDAATGTLTILRHT